MNVSKWVAILYGKLSRWGLNLIKMIPNIVLALIVLILFYFLGRLVKKLVFRILHRFSGKEAISGETF